MSGTNPYQTGTASKLPERPYRLTFLPMNVTLEIQPEQLPASGEGLPGSILDIALASGIDVDHACGGVCACSTCHIIVREGEGSCPEPTEDEEDMLDNAPGLELGSRLACQAVPDGSSPVTVEIPNWNRNHAQEATH
ncbi:MAG TPA: 2Fe-2S iron-sulfur cluster binding domain-containing protein [Planctomycetes bacterium]|nr:2Fe-2S iron-sulfur cluster binding domain-containing protein [Planctomycetota bacterium]HIK62323.1 2Fe-2S iron-sulfur cluster binding domain-containing protein [Planctomycetota bacterium]